MKGIIVSVGNGQKMTPGVDAALYVSAHDPCSQYGAPRRVTELFDPKLVEQGWSRP